MTQNYGGSFAQRLIDQGKFDEAVTLASREAERDPVDPEHLMDRAGAFFALERYGDAVKDLEKALALDAVAQVLETDFLDDSLFSALLAEARAAAPSDLRSAIARLEHYLAVFPMGRHLADVELWSGRLRGEGRDAIIVKERLT
jgi:tetratricopeptide (TPR) repeat protein